MKLLCLTTRLDRPSTRYRLLQYIPYINSSGIETDVVVIPKGFRRLRGIKRYDGVFIQKKLFSRIEQWYLRRNAGKIIFDFDDAVMYTKSNFSTSSRRCKRFRYMAGIADLIIAGNEYLAGYSRKAIVVPTVVDVSKYPIHSLNNMTLGWIGTESTQGYLEMIIPVLRKIPNVRVKIVSDRRPGFCDGKIVWERWSEERELDQLVSFDIGLMPLADDPWTRGKCGFKIIQYMAAGIPVVCSPVGVNTNLVRDGVNGFLASSLLEWETKITRILMDTDLYRRMSRAGRETVEKGYDIRYWGPVFAKRVYDSIYNYS